MGAPEAPLGGSREEPREDGGGGLEGTDGGPEPRRGGAGQLSPCVPVGLRRSERGQRCRRLLALRDGHIPLQGRAEAAALPPAPRTQASVRATPPAPGQTPRPPELWGLRRPAPSRPAARPHAARLAGPAPGWGAPPGCQADAPVTPSGLGGDMASLMPLSPCRSSRVLLLVSCDLGFVPVDWPPSPVNVTVTHPRANSATVS
ncbi:iroquois-class homeodomain protein IRX-3-like [Sapajus apella]|uniref:Iroquois-class homeodomain protein IRX-3-like n=1 Tax=Sapajus apella TaxID=9515 RepID=A0A6J3J6L2_SAPAP|nr:iroquois-class homeodomain protein IRX-3-like [Sapajus apella]